MTSGFTLMPAFCTSAAASKTARDLHLGDFRIDDAQPAAAETEHRIELVQFLDALLDLLDRHAHLLGQVLLRRVVVRQEFVQRRIEETDGRRQAFQFLEDADEIRPSGKAAIWPAPSSRSSEIVGQNHLAHGVNAVALEEHVLGAAQADAGGAERDARWRSVPACRRWCGPGACVTFEHQSISFLNIW